MKKFNKRNVSKKANAEKVNKKNRRNKPRRPYHGCYDVENQEHG